MKKERLSRNVIVSRAVELADGEGLDAVTIRRLADDHGVTPMALYWHFKDKEQLLDGIAERLIEGVQLPAFPAGRWDSQLRDVLEEFLAAMRPHPATANLVLTRILDSEAGLVVADRVLGLLRRARYSPDEAAEIGSYLLCSVITLVTSEPGPEAVLSGDDREAAIRVRRAHLGSLEPKRFPNIIASSDALGACRNHEDYYARGVELLIQGVRGLQRTRLFAAN